MLLGHKKNQKTESNWCLILNPLFNEIDKRKVARKISEAFSLSIEEAEDLVNNTPIILLDNLSQAVAQQVKDYFRPTGANLLLTNEIYVKRKCYRTVWPEPPSLAFLNKSRPNRQIGEESVDETQRLPANEALDHIRSLRETAEEISKPDLESIERTVAGEEREQLIHQLELLKKERDEWQKRFESQRRTLEKMSWEMAVRDNGAGGGATSNNLVVEREREIEKQKALLNSAQEQYEAIQQEYQQARNLFEEKLRAALREVHEWKERYQVLEKEVKGLKQKQDEESSRYENVNQEQSQLKKEKDDLLRKSLEDQAKYETLLAEFRQLKAKFEEQSKASDLKDAESPFVKELQEKIKRLEAHQSGWIKEKSMWSESIRKEEEKRSLLETEYRGLKSLMEEKILLAEKETNEWKFRYEEMTDKVNTLEKSQKRLIEELDVRRSDSNGWQLKARELNDSLTQLKNSHDNLEKMLEVNLRHLENRERELETTRRQLKEIKDQMDQKEAVQKRSLLATIITEKETRLNELIEEQQRVENEIKIRESTIRKILAEQEKVEKEILEGKQSQRHYMEQIKKEKNSKLKFNKDDASSKS